MPPTYAIRSVHDFLRVPRARRVQCLNEFMWWLAQAEEAIRRDPPNDLGPFLWRDDGIGGVRVQPEDRRPQKRPIGVDLLRP